MKPILLLFSHTTRTFMSSPVHLWLPIVHITEKMCPINSKTFKYGVLDGILHKQLKGEKLAPLEFRN